MGYNAFVACNCYKEGKTIEPPHKQFLAHDEYGWFLKFPNDICLDEESNMETEFNEWISHACNHQEMYFCHYSLSTIAGMTKFHKLVESYGGTTIFPLLSEYLPICNEGFLPSNLAAPFKQELLLLQSIIPDGVEIHAMKITFIHHMITTLKKLCDASIETGNPIAW